jgi:hypothetical protein
MSQGPLEAVDRIVASGGEADDVLRAVVDLLAAQPGIAWAGIFFREDGELSLGPQAGRREEARRVRTPIVYDGAVVGELAVDGEADATLVAQVAIVVAPYTLLGWDTGGEVWEP